MKAHAETQQLLADALDIHREKLRPYLREEGNPGKTKHGYHIQKWGDFIKSVQEARVGGGGLKDGKLKREIEILDIRIKTMRGELIDLDEHTADIQQVCRILTQGCDEWEAIAAAEFPDDPRMLEITQRIVDRVRTGAVAKLEAGE